MNAREENEALEEASRRGDNARRLIENPEFCGALVVIKAELMAEFERTTFRQTAERDEIWRKLQAVSWLENTIGHVVMTGQLASKTLLQRVKSGLKRVI